MMKQACRYVAAMLTVACAATSLQAEDTRIIASQRSQQQRAQRLLQEMLTQVIDTRLRQLEENAMTAIPLYKDLAAMRRRGDELVRKEMTDAVALLDQAASGDAGRVAAFKTAQTKMHQILLRLLAERERLRLQRKQAELIDQLRIVIARQKAVRRATLSLAAAAEQAVLVSIRSQRDVNLLCGRLHQVLEDASTQPGELGAIATEAVRALQAAKVAEAMNLAAKHLTTADFTQAARQQQDAIKGLQRAMGILRKASRDALMKARDFVIVLLRDQELLREQVRTKTMTEANIEKWLGAQIKITDRVGGIAKFLGGNQRAVWLVDLAEAASNTARQAVFAADQRRTVDRQGKVIGALAQVLEELKRQIAATGDLTAKEYRDLYQKLSATERILEAVVAMHQQAVAGGADPKKAAAVEKDVKGMLEPFLDQAWLPVAVASRLRTATERVDAAAIAFNQRPADSATAARQADRAIRHALGEASEAAARILRRSLATEVGELNRAAEALARAEAVSSYIASRLQDAELSDAVVGRAIGEIQKIRLLASKVAEGVKDTAPDAVAPLNDLVKMPQPTTQPATPRKQIAKHTEQAAVKLEKAARSIRTQMQVAAKRLREAVTEEISEVELILTDLNGLVGGLSQPTLSEVNDFADEAMISTPAIGATLLRAASAMEKAAVKKPAVKEPAARKPVTRRGEKPEKIDPQRELQRSRIVAEMKVADLKRELADVNELIRLAEMQQDAALDIADIAGMLEDEFLGEGDEELTGDLAADLTGAMEDIAGAMTGAGMLAQAISGITDMANVPLVEATEIASELGMDLLEGEGEGAGEGELPGAGTPMGAGMVPASAMGTAEMMAAGAAPAAFGAMSMSLGTGTGTGRGMGAGLGALGLGAAGPGGLGGGGSSGDGPAFANMERLFGLAIYLPSETGGDSRVNTKRPGDARLGPGVYDEGHAWLVSLPDAVREAVKSRGKRTMPNGYEELLKRYFQGNR